MNSRSPNPWRTKRGPRPPCASFTPTTTCSSPLAMPAPSRWASCAFRSSSIFRSGMVSSMELLQHVVDHRVQAVARRPVPLFARSAVVDRLRPGIGDGLPPGIDRVLDVECGKALLDRFPDLGRREVQGAQVVRIAVDEPRGL